jgi:tripartite-type tricarboxylate transporter receptor subunit TctC
MGAARPAALPPRVTQARNFYDGGIRMSQQQDRDNRRTSPRARVARRRERQRRRRWKPSQPVEFIVTAGPGGGTDNFARTIRRSSQVQARWTSRSSSEQGRRQRRRRLHVRQGAVGDPHKVTFATNNEYLLPLIAKLAWKGDDFTPVAAMALDEFILWVNGKSDYKTAKAYIDAVKAKPDTFKMGGSQSKDTDQTLTSEITAATGAKFLYVPFKSGGEAAVQLAAVTSTRTPTTRAKASASGRADS